MPNLYPTIHNGYLSQTGTRNSPSKESSPSPSLRKCPLPEAQCIPDLRPCPYPVDAWHNASLTADPVPIRLTLGTMHP